MCEMCRLAVIKLMIQVITFLHWLILFIWLAHYFIISIPWIGDKLVQFLIGWINICVIMSFLVFQRINIIIWLNRSWLLHYDMYMYDLLWVWWVLTIRCSNFILSYESDNKNLLKLVTLNSYRDMYIWCRQKISEITMIRSSDSWAKKNKAINKLIIFCVHIQYYTRIAGHR